MMKRILTLVLSLIFIFTSFSLVGAAQKSDYLYNPEDAELLSVLGVTESEKLTGTQVTRAQFVRYAMKLAGIPITPYKGTGFADVPQTHPEYSYIMSAVDFGLISIADNFRPEDAIAPTEAVKIVVELLGYDFMAEAKGGYPSGYLQTAQTIELLDGVNISSSTMTDYDVCTLLCNALKVHLPEVSYTDEGASQYRIGTSTILQKYRGIVEVFGVIDGVSHYSEFNAAGLGDNMVSINGTVYNTGELNCDLLYGYDVVAYYDTNAKKLISCIPSDSNKVLSVYAEDIESVTQNSVTYTDKDSKSRSISVNIDTTIFYNGKIFDYDLSKMLPESGSLTFVSSNGSGAYSTIYIKSYKTIVVSRTSMSDEYFIIDKYSNENTISFDPDDTKLVITNQDGDSLEFSQILAGDVVNAAVSDDGKLVELICVKDEFMGTYSGYNANYVEVDGSDYRLSSSLEGKVSEIISLGKQAIFRLDIDHRIADIIPSTGVGEEIGYLVVGKAFESGLSSKLSARILNTNGIIYDYDFADTFTINGKTYKDFKLAYNTFKSPDYESLLCSIVKYGINNEGKIRSIIYPDNMGGNSGLYHTNSLTNNSHGYKFSRWYNNIGNSIICNTDMIIFKVPNPLYSVDSVDDDLYTVEQYTLITEDGSTEGYDLSGYTTNPDDGMSKYLLMQKVENDMSSEVAVSGPAYMVNSVKQMLVDGEICEAMELCSGNYGVSSPLVVYSKGENDFSKAGVQGGDIVRIEANERNIVRGFEVIWSKGDELLSNGSTTIASGSLKNAHYRINMAYAYSVRTDVLDAVAIDVDPESVTDTSLAPLYMPLGKVFKFDERLKSVVELDMSEIKDYKNFGDKKTKFIYNTTYESFENIFIIE